MNPSRSWRLLRGPVMIAALVIAVAICAAFANVALLGSTGEDRLGRLSPVDPSLSIPAKEGVRTTPSTSTARPPAVAPARPVSPISPVIRDDHGSASNRSPGDDDD